MRTHPAFSPAVEEKLALARMKANGQQVNATAIARLLELGDEVWIIRALDAVLNSPNPIRNLSGYLIYMAKTLKQSQSQLSQVKPVKSEYSMRATVEKVLAGTPDSELERLAQAMWSSPENAARLSSPENTPIATPGPEKRSQVTPVKSEYSMLPVMGQVRAFQPGPEQRSQVKPVKSEYSMLAVVEQILTGTPDMELERFAQAMESSPENAARLSSPENTPIATPSPEKRMSQFAEERSFTMKPKKLFQDSSPRSSGSRSSMSEQDRVFGQLEFQKRHLIFKYFTPDCCMRDLSTDDFKLFKTMGVSALETWLGHKSGANKKRSFHEGCDYKKVHIAYTCSIDKTGRVTSTDVVLEREGTPLQRAFGDDFVLRVNLKATSQEANQFEAALKLVQVEGLHIGMRTYRFYGFKDEQRKKNRGFSLTCRME